jgi:hypothetical protein
MAGSSEKPTTVPFKSKPDPNQIPKRSTRIINRKNSTSEKTPPTSSKTKSTQSKDQGSMMQNENLKNKPRTSDDSGELLNKESRSRKYRTRKCFIVHDPFLKHFDKDRFTSWLETTNQQFRSIP